MYLLVKMKFGSHLYGTATESSDTDYKGIFLPSEREIFLGQIPKSINETTKKTSGLGIKNTSEDVDTEIYSLHYFIRLACEGQTVALDMLHAPDNMLLHTSEVWDKIIENRDKFYTRNLKAFIGYARKQAAKYGVKGSRLNDAKVFIDLLKEFNASYPKDVIHLSKLDDLWDKIPSTEHIKFVGKDSNGIDLVQVCGKTFGRTSKIDYVLPIIENFYTIYGARAQAAANNEGIDWKAISHALRAAYQVREILTEKTITFPLKEREYLLAVKKGELLYNEVSLCLESLMTEIEELSTKSSLPDHADVKFWDDFIVKTVRDYI